MPTLLALIFVRQAGDPTVDDAPEPQSFVRML